MRSAVMLVGFLLTGADAAPVPKDFKKPDDKTRLVGTWALVKANVGGQDDPNYFWHAMTFAADGTNRFRYRDIPDQENEYKLDTAASPKTLSFLRNAAVVGHPRPYEFRAGRLVVAVGTGGQNPLDSLRPGPGVIVLEYERADAK